MWAKHFLKDPAATSNMENSRHDHTHITHYYCFFPTKRGTWEILVQEMNQRSQETPQAESWWMWDWNSKPPRDDLHNEHSCPGSSHYQISTSTTHLPKFPQILMWSSKASHDPLLHHDYKLNLSHPHCPKLVQTARSPCHWVCTPKNVLKICSIN